MIPVQHEGVLLSPNSMYGLSAMTFSAVTLGLQGASASFVSFYPSIKKVGTFSANKLENKVLSHTFFRREARPAVDDAPDDDTRRNFMFSLGSAATFSPLYAGGAVPTQLDNDFAKLQENSSDTIRIAIIGGGIAGITAASSIASRLQDKNVKIVVYEADSNANAPFQVNQPKWTAATARNANSIVPGSSMHVMAQRSTLRAIARDTAREWIMLRYQSLKQLRSNLSTSKLAPLLNIDNFEIVPPYFAVNLVKCMGPRVPSEERWTFLTFMRHFVPTSLLTDAKEADERGKHTVQLAKANRHILMREFDEMSKDPQFSNEQLGIGKGFLSLHRTKKAAEHAVQEGKDHDEPAHLLSYKEAVELEPHIKNLPMSPIYAVHRPNDFTANCLVFVQGLKKRCTGKLGVEFKEQQEGIVQNVEQIKSTKDSMAKLSGRRLPVTAADGLSNDEDKGNDGFRITTADGQVHKSDYLVLAAGVNTPLFARQLNAGHCCPTYALRGFSLTLHTEDENVIESKKNAQGGGRSSNLLNRPISVDSMYVSSVGPNMARLAGYGELVGYRKGAENVSSVGPRVLTRYGRTIFPEAAKFTTDTAMQCFRPMSPDDLPLAGKVSSVPGLFLHTGHGTLGWTLSMATAECVAQAVCDDLDGVNNVQTFDLPDKTKISRSIISPDRFV